MRLKHVVAVMLLCSFSVISFGQRTFAPLDIDYYHLLDREDIAGNLDTQMIHTSVKPYDRGEILGLVRNQNIGLDRDGFNRTYLITDNQLPPLTSGRYQNTDLEQEPFYFERYSPKSKFLSHFYSRPNAMFLVDQKDFQMVVNPVIGFSSGVESPSEATTYQNTRGFQIHGMIGEKVGFQTFFSENQFRFPSYFAQRIEDQGVINGVGLKKDFGAGGYDFLDAKGSITFNPIKQIGIQFGHDNNFIGNGYRSLILSDHSNEALFLKVRTKVWRLQYTNLFLELSDLERLGGSGNNQRKKFMTFHHLNLKITKNLSIGLFESIIFARNDSNDTPGYDINYLNPIIFYRAVEHSLNSSDNSLLGIDWKWNFLNTFSFYGQAVLDELREDSLLQRTGWWGNKWALQAGLKYINAFKVSNLDLQFETNVVRPYTYTHAPRSQNYTHHNQPLAHPLGANFREYIGIVRYQLGTKIRLTGIVMFAEHGRDSISRNAPVHYGGNLLEDYTKRPKESGIEIGDGFKQNIRHIELRATWQLYHNVFMDISYVNRVSSGPIRTFNFDVNYLQVSTRINLPYFGTDF